MKTIGEKHRVMVNHSRRLRRDSSLAERWLWRLIRDRRILGFKFRRQHAVGHYILDFYCSGLRLAVEVDGRHHGEVEQAMFDQARSMMLAGVGIKVERVSAKRVFLSADEVLRHLVDRILSRAWELSIDG